MLFAGAEVIEADCWEGLCPYCQDHCLEGVDSHDQENVVRCAGCGFSEEVVVVEGVSTIVIPPYEQ